VSKLGAEKVVFDFLCENGLEKDYKDHPFRTFCCHKIFSPIFGCLEFGGEIFYSIFFRENGKEESTWTILEEFFCCRNSFYPFLGVEFWG